jgi:hypothetical protein
LSFEVRDEGDKEDKEVGRGRGRGEKRDWMVQRKVGFRGLRENREVEDVRSCCFGTRMPRVGSWAWDVYLGV